MNSIGDFEIASPDRRHVLRFKCAGEIPFGPMYYNLWVDRVSLGSREFWQDVLWHPESQLVAVREKLSGATDQLVVFDVRAQKEWVVSQSPGGFIKPKGFEGKALIYEKDYSRSLAVIKEYEQDLPGAAKWRAYYGV